MLFVSEFITLIAESVISVICLLTIMSTVLGLKERSRPVTIITAVTVLTLSVVNAFMAWRGGFTEDALDNADTLIIFLQMISPLIIMKVHKYLKTVIELFTVIISVEAFFGIIAFLLNVDSRSFEWSFYQSLISVCVYIVLSAALLVIKRKTDLSIIKNVIDSIPKWLIPVWYILTLTVYFLDFSRNDSEYDTSRVVNVLFAVSAVCIFVCIIYFVYKIFSMSYQQVQILKQLEEQHLNYEAMLSSDQQLREFRHDYKNHLLVVTAFLNAGKTEEAAEYLENIKIQSGVKKRQISSGSFVADAILNNKNLLAEDLGITLNLNGTIPEKGVSASDMCTILSNLIDNAIDNTKMLSGEKYINIETKYREPFFILSVINPVNECVSIKNNRIKTSKNDTKNHGLGLKNVERTVQKYDGKLHLSCDEKEFTADISLKIK